MGCFGATAGTRQTGIRPPGSTSRGVKEQPLSPFPTRKHYTLALNNLLTAPPAYGGGSGYFPIEGDRIASYQLDVGQLRWLVDASPVWTPAVAGDVLIVALKHSLAALRTADGTTAWMKPLPAPLIAAPLCDQGWLIVATATELLAFRSADGSMVWQQPLAGVRAVPSIEGNRLYVSLAGGRVQALRLDTGANLWNRKIGGEPNEIAATADRLFVGSTDNFIYALKAADGALDWSVQTGADVVNRPLLDGDRLYFVSLDNVLRALNGRNGVQLWKKALPFRPGFPPLKAADAIVVASTSGLLRAYFMKDGQSAGDATADNNSDIAAPLYAMSSSASLGPILIMVTKLIAEGASVVAVSRTIDPQATLLNQPLPGVTPVAVPKIASPAR